MKKKSIKIISHFCGELDGRLSNRFVYISNYLSQYYDVELITSDFYHTLKKKKLVTGDYSFKITLIKEPGYRTNKSLKRLFSHYIFGRNLGKYLKRINRSEVDLVYVSIPSISIASTARNYAIKIRKPCVIDIQDLWPESFTLLFKYSIISKLIIKLFSPKVNWLYRSADGIIGVSEQFVSRALSVRPTTPPNAFVYIGTDRHFFYNQSVSDEHHSHKNNCVRLVYLGSLAESYDLITAMQALRILLSNNIGKQITLEIIGDGPSRNIFESFAKEFNLPVTFHGLINYEEVQSSLMNYDIALNPIRKESVSSIINKHGEYAMSGLPVINTQPTNEYRTLLNRYKCGINCEPENAHDVASAIIKLSNDESLRKEMSQNARKMGEELFDRQKTYAAIHNLVDRLL